MVTQRRCTWSPTVQILDTGGMRIQFGWRHIESCRYLKKYW